VKKEKKKRRKKQMTATPLKACSFHSWYKLKTYSGRHELLAIPVTFPVS
jgi:hypothetical protein